MAVAALLAFAPLAWATARDSVEFLYIDANVGGSSGGHVAVKLGETVYHFQNDEGYTRLTRENWWRFRFIYNDVDNRNIHIARVPVRATDAERIRDRLSLLYLVQNRHVAFLHALRDDERLLQSLQTGLPAQLPGIGFFQQRPRASSSYGEFRALVERRQGPHFMARERQRLTRRLAALRYAPVAIGDAGLSPDHYPAYPQTFSEQTQDLYARWFALSVMALGWPLREEVLIDAGRLDNGDPAGRERVWLSQYRESVREAILHLLSAPYPGSGQALLLSLARHEALSLSLASGKLLVLDVLAHPVSSPRQALAEQEREPLQRLARQLGESIPPLRQTVFSLPEPDEAAFHRLEIAASERREAERGLAFRRSINLSTTEGPPEGLGYTLLPPRHDAPTAWVSARVSAETRADEFMEKMQSAYAYQLITRNCVTELARAVNSSFAEHDEARALGGHLEPGAAQGFVPFRFLELVRRHYRVTGTETLPSLRNRQLARLRREGEGWAVPLRESNTLTSTVYQPRAGDSAFLMFTEHGFWTRPLFGALNLGYGLGAAAAGVVTAPADAGELLREGLNGMLFSLPELAFWNIRKGSFSELNLSWAERD